MEGVESFLCAVRRFPLSSFLLKERVDVRHLAAICQTYIHRCENWDRELWLPMLHLEAALRFNLSTSRWHYRGTTCWTRTGETTLPFEMQVISVLVSDWWLDLSWYKLCSQHFDRLNSKLMKGLFSMISPYNWVYEFSTFVLYLKSVSAVLLKLALTVQQ